MVATLLVLIITVFITLLIHESGHILAIIFTRAGRVKGIVVCLKGIGVKWEFSVYDPVKRSVVSLAGPIASLISATIFYSIGFDNLGFVNLLFGLLNLLPLPGSDGLKTILSLKEAV